MGVFKHFIFLFFKIKKSSKLKIQPEHSCCLLSRERAESLILHPLIIFFPVIKLKINSQAPALIKTIKWLDLNEEILINSLMKNHE